MHLVQILLPLYDNHGQRFEREPFDQVRDELTNRFGGLTAYARAPAEGLWKPGSAPANRDEIVIYEVMVESLDRPWWATYRRHLETVFAQQSIIVRSSRFELL